MEIVNMIFGGFLAAGLGLVAFFVQGNKGTQYLFQAIDFAK